MNPEIENLINMALADGEVTEKERSIILKKAEVLDLDVDEVEMILDGRIALIVKENTTEQIKNNKEGDIQKCPSCGSPVTSFSLTCNYCGHEFRNTKSSHTIQDFFKEFKIIPKEQQSNFINNYPIPNNKEDILEFLSLAIGNCNYSILVEKNTYKEREILAWQNKVNTIIHKGKIAFANDNSLFLIQEFEKELSKITRKNFIVRNRKEIIGMGLTLIILIFGFVPYWSNQNKNHDLEVNKEKERLELVMNKVNNLIDGKEYEKSKIFISQLKWEYSDAYSHRDTDELKKSWDEKREKMLLEIENKIKRDN